MSSVYPSAALPEKLRDSREKLKFLAIVLTGISLVLLLDLLFVSPTESDTVMFTANALLPLALGCIGATGFVAHKYLQTDLEIQRLSRDDLVYGNRQLHIEKSKELLKRASRQTSYYKGLKLPSVLTERAQSSVPLEQREQYRAPPTLNLRSFEYSDDVAETFMRSKGIDKKMREWVQNIRLWFAKDLIPLVMSNHIENLVELNKLLRAFTGSREKPWIYEDSFDDSKYLNLSYEELHYYKRASLREIEDLVRQIGCDYTRDLNLAKNYHIHQHPSQEQNHAILRLQFLEFYRHRLILEQFFEVPGYNARAYTINRLHKFCNSNYLHGYSCAAGGEYLGDSWTAKRPTDAHILAHLFFRTLNNANNLTTDPLFSMMDEIITSSARIHLSALKDAHVRFFQKNPESSVEPHYDVLSGRDTWLAYRGSDNLFSAIALFLLHVKQKSNGYFGSTNLKEWAHLIS